MNAHIIGVASCAALAFAIQSLGPRDESLAAHVVGGVNCNHSDYVTFDCVEINGRTVACRNVQVGAEDVQSCLDILVESQTICTQNNCENVTKDKRLPDDCTKVNCTE